MKIEIQCASVLLSRTVFSLSQKIVKSHVSNYLNIKNKHKTYLQLITIRFQKLKTFFKY
jgi:hypothetical protein